MAFNISVVRDGDGEFGMLHDAAEPLDRRSVTVFPIAANQFSNEQGIGLSINMSADTVALWPGLRAFVQQASAAGYRIIELYDGTDVTDQPDVILRYLE